MSSEIPSSRPWKKIGLFAVIAIAIVAAYTLLGDRISLETLATREAELRALQSRQPLLLFAAAFSIYVGITGLSLPGAAVLSLTYAWYFGFWRALLLVSFASTAGATVAFLLSRYLFRDMVEHRFGDRLQNFNDALQREGPFFLFTMRLIPAFPFFVINAVMGLTPIKTFAFWWVSQIGMLPGTAVYVYAGSRVPNLQTLADEGINAVFSPQQLTQIFVAFALLGLFPLIVRYSMYYFTKSQVPSSSVKR